jgi:hydroxyacylglutathione hydrolase
MRQSRAEGIEREKGRDMGDDQQSTSGQRTGTGALEVDVASAHALLLQGAQLIDVREPGEFLAGHAEGARSIPLGELREGLDALVPGSSVLLICDDGTRSWSAQRWLQRLGRADVYNIVGGTSAWVRAGLPTRIGQE